MRRTQGKKFIVKQQRPDGSNENNDCVIRAISYALGIPYAEVHAEFSCLGRAYGKSTHQSLTDQFLERRALVKSKAWYTVAEFLRLYKRGMYILRVRGHLFAVDGGRVVDDVPFHLGLRVHAYWEVYSSDFGRYS